MFWVPLKEFNPGSLLTCVCHPWVKENKTVPHAPKTRKSKPTNINVVLSVSLELSCLAGRRKVHHLETCGALFCSSLPLFGLDKSDPKEKLVLLFGLIE